ncbi:MAG: hypothetical protein K6F33_07705 [Bacteroidales bacterium]|nr:hypothetical protein [Bacteroidales bacterium]
MKKIASILAMLMMVLTLSISFNSCSSITIGAAIAQLNNECPQDMGDGLTMTSAELIDGNAVITINAPTASSAGVAAAKPALVEFVKQNAEFSQLLKDSNTSLIYRFKCSDGTTEVSVAPNEL